MASWPVKKGWPVPRVVHRGEQLRIGLGLQDVADRAAAQNLARDVLREVHRQHQNIRGGRLLTSRPRNLQPIHFGHGKVQHQQVRLLFLHVIQGLGSRKQASQHTSIPGCAVKSARRPLRTTA